MAEENEGRGFETMSFVGECSVVDAGSDKKVLNDVACVGTYFIAEEMAAKKEFSLCFGLETLRVRFVKKGVFEIVGGHSWEGPLYNAGPGSNDVWESVERPEGILDYAKKAKGSTLILSYKSIRYPNGLSYPAREIQMLVGLH